MQSGIAYTLDGVGRVQAVWQTFGAYATTAASVSAAATPVAANQRSWMRHDALGRLVQQFDYGPFGTVSGNPNTYQRDLGGYGGTLLNR